MRFSRHLGAGLATLLAACGLGLFGAAHRVAHGLTHRRGAHPARETPPTDVAVRELRLCTADAHRIGAWYVAGRAGRPVVLLLHGNVASRSSRLPELRALVHAGYGVLAVSLRAHGDSSGDYYRIGADSTPEIEAAVGWLEAHAAGRPIIVDGFSLGAAAALYAASALGTRVDGYLLESPYSSLDRAVRNRTRQYLPAPLDWVAYRALLAVGPAHLGAAATRFRPLDRIGDIPAPTPVVITGGTDDTSCHPDELRAFQRRRPRARLIMVEAHGHRPLFAASRARYLAAIASLERP